MLFAKLFVLLTVVVLGLLSLQAEPVTATLGWILASIWLLAIVLQTVRGK